MDLGMRSQGNAHCSFRGFTCWAHLQAGLTKCSIRKLLTFYPLSKKPLTPAGDQVQANELPTTATLEVQTNFRRVHSIVISAEPLVLDHLY